jgi:hypothetical protein
MQITCHPALKKGLRSHFQKKLVRLTCQEGNEEMNAG